MRYSGFTESRKEVPVANEGKRSLYKVWSDKLLLSKQSAENFVSAYADMLTASGELLAVAVRSELCACHYPCLFDAVSRTDKGDAQLAKVYNKERKKSTKRGMWVLDKAKQHLRNRRNLIGSSQAI